MLARHYYVAADHVLYALYKPGCRSGVQARLKRLAEAGLLLRLYLPRVAVAGSSPRVYTLTARGRRLVQALGHPVPHRFRPGEARDLTAQHLAHTLLCVSAYLAVERGCQALGTLWVADLKHERDVRPLPVLLDGGKRGYAPDGWQDIRERVGGAVYQYGVLWEIDRATHTNVKPRWFDKLSRLAAFLDQGYADFAGTNAVTVAIVAAHGEDHAQRLCAWTREWLAHKETGSASLAAAVRITGTAPLAVVPRAFLAEPHWLTSAGERTTLLPLKGGELAA